MDSRTRDRSPSPDAVEFVRFCYRRRRVGWPELYDEMCAVASRGLYRGWGSEELNAEGIRFGLFDMPTLAALVNQIVADEHSRRAVAHAARVVAVNPAPPDVASQPAVDHAAQPVAEQSVTDPATDATPATVRFAPVPAGA
jgi:hypothetical protein